jgi:hypothetical protein
MSKYTPITLTPKKLRIDVEKKTNAAYVTRKVFVLFTDAIS